MIEDVNYILENRSKIETKIDYQFSNKNLLIQAFTRKSFAAEHEEYENNEVLEFYGDQLVNSIMTKWLFDSFSSVPQNYSNDFFYSTKSESELSKIRAKYVNKSALAHCIEILGLDEYLLLGNSDEKNEVWLNEKVRCDLFEAIIGAIAIDSANRYSSNKWDFEKIEKSCKTMWGMLGFKENYIDMLYDMCEDFHIAEPQFSVSQSYYGNQSVKCKVVLYIQNEWNPERIEGEGNSEMEAKMNAAKKALNFLHKYQIEQIAGRATPETAVQILNTLYLKKFISKPEFDWSVSPDDDGKQIWCCECFIKEYENWEGYYDRGIGEEYTKAAAKQSAAYDMICFMLGKENDLGEKFICPYCGAEKDSEDEICPVCNDNDDDD